MMTLMMVFLACSGIATSLVVAALMLSSRISRKMEEPEIYTPDQPDTAEIDTTISP